MFPRVFLPGPMDVVRSFGSLVYKGILPDLFKEGKGVVAQGQIGNDGVLVAIAWLFVKPTVTAAPKVIDGVVQP